MNIRSLIAVANTGFVFLLGAGIAAQAAEVRVLGSYSMRSIMNEVAPKFEHATGHRLAIKFDTPKKIAASTAASIMPPRSPIFLIRCAQ